MKKQQCIICEEDLINIKYPHCWDCSTEIFLRRGYVYCKNEFCDKVLSPKTKLKWDYCKDCNKQENKHLSKCVNCKVYGIIDCKKLNYHIK